MDGQTLNGYILVVGSLGMMSLALAIIFFIYRYQKKMFVKQKAFSKIEALLQKEELKSAYALIQGKEEERKRIAEDLHDNIGSILASLRMYSDVLAQRETDEELKSFALKIAELTEQAGNETRRISHELDTGIIRYSGLSTAIEQLCSAITKAHNMQFTLVLDVQPTLDEVRTLNIYRMVQELLNNSLKHADATHIRLEVSQVDHEYVSIIFEDNGKGFNVNEVKQGIGLLHIRSRTERFRGNVTIDSTPGKGTTCIIEIPLGN